MQESIFLIIGIAIGYALCYISTQHAASATERALEVMTSAFNARFGVRAKEPVSVVKLAETSEVPTTHINTEADIPKKAQFDLKPPDIRSMRADAIRKVEEREKAMRNASRMAADHL